jgi:hypothetical protein
MIAKILGVTALGCAIAAPALADDGSPRPVSDPSLIFSAQADAATGPRGDPRAEQIAGRPSRERAQQPWSWTPSVSFDVTGGKDFVWLPKVPAAFDINHDGIGSSPGRVTADDFGVKINVPAPFTLWPGSGDSHFELRGGFVRGNRIAENDVPNFVDVFPITGSGSGLLFGGPTGSPGISSETVFTRNYGDLLLASKYDPCGVPVKIETGFGYQRIEQDHNYLSLMQNQVVSAFRMHDHVDTDYYSAVVGATAYKRLGEGFTASAGLDLRFGVAHSSLDGSQILNGLDFSDSASRTKFAFDTGVKLGLSYRLTRGVELGLDATYRYNSEVGRTEYPSRTGTGLRLGGDSAQSLAVLGKFRWSFAAPPPPPPPAPPP